MDKVVDLMFYYLKNWDRKQKFDLITIKIEIPLRSIDEDINKKMKIGLDTINNALKKKWEKKKETKKPHLLHHIKHKTITIHLSHILIADAGFNLLKANNDKLTINEQIKMRQKLKEFIKFQWDQEMEQINQTKESINMLISRPKNQFEDIPDYEWDLDAIYGQAFVTDDAHYDFDTMHVFFLNTTENSANDNWLT